MYLVAVTGVIRKILTFIFKEKENIEELASLQLEILLSASDILET